MVKGAGGPTVLNALVDDVDDPPPDLEGGRCVWSEVALPVSSTLTLLKSGPSEAGLALMGGLDVVAGAGVEASLLYDGKPARIFCRSVISATLGIFMDGRGAVIVGLVEVPCGIEADELDADGRPAPSLPEGKADDEAVFLKLGNAFFDASADVDDGPVPGTEFFFASSIKWSKLLTAFSISSFLDSPIRSVSCFLRF